MSPIATHVLDVSRGKPASGVAARIELWRGQDGWRELARGATNEGGRIRDWILPSVKLEKGIYRIIFETGAYFRAQQRAAFYPIVEITFEIERPEEHYHVPLLLSPLGYSTYRGS